MLTALGSPVWKETDGPKKVPELNRVQTSPPRRSSIPLTIRALNWHVPPREGIESHTFAG